MEGNDSLDQNIGKQYLMKKVNMYSEFLKIKFGQKEEENIFWPLKITLLP